MIHSWDWYVGFLAQILHCSNFRLDLEFGHKSTGDTRYKLLMVDKRDQIGLKNIMSTQKRSDSGKKYLMKSS